MIKLILDLELIIPIKYEEIAFISDEGHVRKYKVVGVKPDRMGTFTNLETKTPLYLNDNEIVKGPSGYELEGFDERRCFRSDDKDLLNDTFTLRYPQEEAKQYQVEIKGLHPKEFDPKLSLMLFYVIKNPSGPIYNVLRTAGIFDYTKSANKLYVKKAYVSDEQTIGTFKDMFEEL